MAGFIELSKNEEWSSSNWVFYSIMDGVLEEVSRLANDELRTEVEQSKWMQTLSLTELPVDDWKCLLIKALRKVCALIESGHHAAKVEGRILDDSSQQEFKNEARRLADQLTSLIASKTTGQ